MKDLWMILANLFDLRLWWREWFEGHKVHRERIDAILEDIKKNESVDGVELWKMLYLNGIGMNPFRMSKLLDSMVTYGILRREKVICVVGGQRCDYDTYTRRHIPQ